MATEKSFLKCMMDHLRLSSDTMKDFAAGVKSLTPKDKAELKAQFEKEFGYTIPENPQVDKGVAG